MNATLFFSLNSLLVLIEMIALYLLGNCFFQCKYRGWQLFLCIVVLTTANIIGHLLVDGSLIAQILLLTLIDTIGVTFVFHTHILKGFVTALFFVSFFLLIDSIFVVSLAAITQHEEVIFTQNPYVYYLLCYAEKIVELLGIVILRIFTYQRQDNQVTTWRDWVRIIMFPLMSVIIVGLLLQIYTENEDAAPHLLLCCIVMVFTDVLAITLLNSLERQQQELHEYAILQHAAKLTQDSVTSWINAYKNQRQQTHDFQNHLSAIQFMIKAEAPEGELSTYVNQLLQTDFSDSLFVHTGRTVVDAILNQKYALAQSKNVELRVRLDDLTKFALSDDELVVVLSNLLDNAIEACEKISEVAKRKIWLTMDVAAKANFIYIENTTAGPVRIRNNHVVTTKQNPMAHGYGLKNVEAILKKYDAQYLISYKPEKQVFCVSMQIISPDL